jgi:hypothetical protein
MPNGNNLPRPHTTQKARANANKKYFNRVLANIAAGRGAVPGEANLPWGSPKLKFEPAVTRRLMPSNKNLANMSPRERERYLNRARKGERSPRSTTRRNTTPNKPKSRSRFRFSKYSKKSTSRP